MDPISLSIAAVSVGMSLFGGFEKYKGAQAQTQTQIEMTQTEQRENDLRQQMMHLSAQREGMELMRNAQRARSLALAGAASHGAQFGSGLPGGFGQISGATNTQGLKISQDTQAGDIMFGLKNQESQEKIDYAREGGMINLGSGIMDIGKVLGAGNSQLTGLLKQLTPGEYNSSNPQFFSDENGGGYAEG